MHCFVSDEPILLFITENARNGCVVPWKVHLNAKEPYCKRVLLPINIPRWWLLMRVVYKALIGSINFSKWQLFVFCLWKNFSILICAFIIIKVLCSVELLWYDFLLYLILVHIYIYWFNVSYFVIVPWFSSLFYKKIRNQSGCFIYRTASSSWKSNPRFDSCLKSWAPSRGQTSLID